MVYGTMWVNALLSETMSGFSDATDGNEELLVGLIMIQSMGGGITRVIFHGNFPDDVFLPESIFCDKLKTFEEFFCKFSD